MICSASGVIIFLTVFGIVASNPDRAIDCRKFVFAPLCRGVAAKRGVSEKESTEPSVYIDAERFKELLKNLYADIGIAEVEAEEEKASNKEEKMGNSLLGKYTPQERDNRIYRLLLGNKRISSETDSIPVNEYENL